MLGSSSIFILLSIFYYEYIPEEAFANDEKEDAGNAKDKENDAVTANDGKEDVGIANIALEVDEKKDQHDENVESSM